MTKGEVKFLILLTAALTVWQIFKIPEVATAFWAFCTAGVIPGTTRVMTPETTLRILCVVFGISIFIIFRKEFFRSLPQRRPKGKNRTAADHKRRIEISAATPKGENRIILILQKQQQRAGFGFAEPLLKALIHCLLGLTQLVSWLEQRLRHASRSVAARARRAVYVVYALTNRLVRFVYKNTLRLVRLLAVAVIYLWRQAEPHVRDFDRWLDTELHRNPKTAQALRIGAECNKALHDSCQKVYAKTRELLHNR